MRMWVTHDDVLHLHEVNENLIPVLTPLCGDKDAPSSTAMMSTEPELIVGKVPCPFCIMIAGGPNESDKSDRR
jgi:hypothetical protein